MNVEPRQPEGSAAGRHQPTPALQRVLRRLPAELRGGFTPAQLVALDRALDANNPTRHVINLRLTLFGAAYLVVLAGPERRDQARRALEREKHPLATPGNLAVLGLLAALGLSAGYALRVLVVGG
ncbi:MAG: hypothetical protein ACFCUW_18280 [Kiloniellaceae bacterium]